jgi:hypothetical protein
MEIATRRDNVHLTDHGHQPALTKPKQRTLQTAKPVGGHGLTLTSIAVLGMTEASLMTTCLLGRRFGLISSGQSSSSRMSGWELVMPLVRRAGTTRGLHGCILAPR